jgi:integrase/recombinase XerC
MTITSFLHFIRYEKRYSTHTIEAYQNDLSQFADYLSITFQLDNPAEADFNMLRGWVVYLSDQNTQAVSINRKMATLKSFYKYLLRKGAISRNPTLRLKPLKTAQKSPVFIEEEKILALLDKFPFDEDFFGWRSKLIMEILYGTGIRLSELINLKSHQIDFDKATIKVFGKRAKERIIPITPTLVYVIQQYEGIKQAHFANTVLSGHLIVSDKGTKSYPSLIYRIAGKYLRFVTTQDKKSPHILRHTFATHLLNKGADLNAIKELLGHANLAATQVYTHNSLERLKEVFERAHPKA